MMSARRTDGLYSQVWVEPGVPGFGFEGTAGFSARTRYTCRLFSNSAALCLPRHQPVLSPRACLPRSTLYTSMDGPPDRAGFAHDKDSKERSEKSGGAKRDDSAVTGSRTWAFRRGPMPGLVAGSSNAPYAALQKFQAGDSRPTTITTSTS